jgi:regulatory protein
LQKGQELDEQEETVLRTQAEEEFAYMQAVRYLGYRPRSMAEMERYLRGKKHDDETVKAVITRLRTQGYLDDSEFAQFWVENRARFRPRSGQALRFELRQRGVAGDIIHEAVDGQDDEAAAWAVVESKLARWQALERPEFEAKVTNFLARRGFGFGVCRRAAARGWAELHDEV